MIPLGFEEKPYKPSDDDLKLTHIEYVLHQKGYEFDGVRSLIDVIERLAIDVSQFEFPFGSYDSFKERVLNGEYDMYEDSVTNCMTEAECARIDKDIVEGKIWVTY